MDTGFYNGIPIRVSDYAVTRVCKVERLPIKKRRKGYRIRAHMEPAMYRLSADFGGAIVMHPTLYAQFRKATGAA